MTITTRTQAVDVTQVTQVVVTTVAQDSDTGEYVREFRILTTDGIVFTLGVRGATQEALEIPAPSFPF